MLPAFKPRDLIQFTNGPKRGLLAQIAFLEGSLKCLSRDMDGTPHIYDLDEAGNPQLVGVAVLGPKQDGQANAARAAEIQPMTENEIAGLLEPLPPEIKPQSMDFTEEEKKALTSSAYAPYRKKRKKTKKVPVKKVMYTAVVSNGMGESVTVTVPVREGLKPTMMTGNAILLAKGKIQWIRPFTVSDWNPVPSDPQNAKVSEVAGQKPENV